MRVTSAEARTERREALLQRFEKEREHVERLRAERLASVKGACVESWVHLGESQTRLKAIEALEQWLDSVEQTVLGAPQRDVPPAAEHSDKTLGQHDSPWWSVGA